MAIARRIAGLFQDVPQDLNARACISLRRPTSGGVCVWPFTKQGQTMRMRPKGQPTYDTDMLMVDTAVADLDLAFPPTEVVRYRLPGGRLARVMAEWSPTMPGFRLHAWSPGR